MLKAQRSDFLADCPSVDVNNTSEELLIVEGVHFNERAAYRVAQILARQSHPGVEIEPVHEDWEKRVGDPTQRPRLYKGQNLALISPGNPNGTPAERKAYHIYERIRKFGLAAVTHSTSAANRQYASYGPRATPRVRRIAKFLCGDKAVIAQEGMVCYVHDNAFEIEFSPNGPLTPEGFVDVLPRLLADDIPDEYPTQELEFCGVVSAEQGAKLKLPPYLPRDSELDLGLARLLGYEENEGIIVNVWDSRLEKATGYRAELMKPYSR